MVSVGGVQMHAAFAGLFLHEFKCFNAAYSSSTKCTIWYTCSLPLL